MIAATGAQLAATRAGTTRVEVTGGVHWYRATTSEHSAEVIAGQLAARFGESVEVVERGRYTYASAYIVGPFRVYWTEGRPECCIDVPGAACEQIGAEGVAWFLEQGWKATRLDLAVDGCPFTPRMVRSAWVAGDVRTRVKVARDALESRAWRACEWSEHPTGDLFGMGRRVSEQYARCYDRRGSTRFELELKGGTAVAASELVRDALQGGARSFILTAVSLIRRFVDFVSAESDTNASRRELLGWWLRFVRAIPTAVVELVQPVRRTLGETREWFKRQVGPLFAVMHRVYGAAFLEAVAAEGSDRWGSRHRRLLSQALHGSTA